MTDPPTNPLPFVVVCTARCGAGTLTRWLREAGVNATHEKLFANHGGPFAEKKRLEYPESDCEVSWCAAPWLMKSRLILTSCVVHLMRNPLGTLDSLVNNVPMFGDRAVAGLGERACVSMLIEKQCPVVYQHEDPYMQAAEYMLAWHEMMMDGYASRAVMCHRIEDNPNKLFKKMRGVQESEKWRCLFPGVPVRDIEWQPTTRRVYTWDDAKQHLPARLLYGLMRLAYRWGYECEF